MKRAGIFFLRGHKKEVLSLVYLFLIGVAFASIWIFHNSKVDESQTALAYEEDHEIIEVVIAETKISAESMEINVEDAWKTNAVNVAASVNDKIQISIVIDDLGMLRRNTFDIIEMKAPLTLSFLPYAPDLHNVTSHARENGHELMVHLPMEPKSSKDPGPHAMLTGVSDRKLMEDLYFNLSQFEGYVGINNHMGSAFTEDPRGLSLILNEVQKKGLLVLDSLTSRGSLFAKMAAERNIPNATRDVFLDNEQDVDYILGQLKKLENKARIRGNAIAIGHPYSQTIEALSIWLPTLKQKGIVVVPLSHLIKRKYEKILFAHRGAKDRQATSSR